MLKKFLIILMCAALMCPSAWAAEYDDNYFETAEYSSEVTFLQSLGILDDEDSLIETDEWTISRAEFVHLAVSAMNFSDLAASVKPECPFKDVSDDNEYINDIAFAAQYKLLGKNPGLVFKPEEPVDINFAALVGVCMTGREFLATGGKAYSAVAQDSKLFEDITFYDGNKLSRGEAISFIINVLNAKVGSVSYISSTGDFEFYIEEGETLLWRCFGVERDEGILTSDGITTVFGEKAEAGYATIDGESYLMLCTDYRGLAGQWVEFYVKRVKNEKPKIQSIEAIKNDILTLSPDMITGFDPISLQYNTYVDGKNTTLQISRNAFVAYNFEPDFDPARMKPQCGVVTLIDHQNNGVYDSVLVYEFTNTVAKSYSSYSEILYDVSDSTYDIDLGSYSSYTVVDVMNNPVDVEAIAKNSVVSLYQSPSKNTARLVVSTNTARGNLTSFVKSKRVYELSGVAYKLSQNVRFTESAFSTGNTYQVFFDAMGEIAYIKSDAGTVAYLLDGEAEGDFEKTVKLLLLDEDTKKAAVAELAKKVKVVRPGIADTTLKAEALLNTVLAPGGACIRTMLLFQKNADDKINKIVMPKEILYYSNSANTASSLLTADDYPLYYLKYMQDEWPDFLQNSNEITYRSSGGAWNRWFIPGSSSLTFYVPRAGEGISDWDSVVAKPSSYSDADTGTQSNLSFYTTDIKDISVPYIVTEAAAVNDYKSIWPCIVTDICQIWDEKLGTTYQLTICPCNGQPQTILVKDPDCMKVTSFEETAGIPSGKTELEIGDIISYIADEAGYITGIKLWWDGAEGIENESNDRFGVSTSTAAVPTNWGAGGWNIMPGIIERISDDNIELSIDDYIVSGSLVSRLQRVKWSKNSAILDFGGRYEPIFTKAPSAGELIPGDRIILFSNTGRCYGMLVYRR